MKELLQIFAGAAVAGTAALSLGCLALGALRVRLRALERWPAALVVGTPVLAALAAALARLHWARRGVFLALALTSLALALWRRRSLVAATAAPPLTPWARAALVVPLLGFGILTLGEAAAPDATPPAAAAALVQARALGAGASAATWDGGSLWLVPYRFGGPSSSAVLHSFCLLALALAVLAAARRLAGPWPAVGAALLVFSSPGLRLWAGEAGAELLFCFLAFGALALAALALAERQVALAVPALLAAVYGWRVGFPPAPVFPGSLWFWLPWAGLLPLLACLVAWAARRQRLWLGLAVAFQLITAWPPLTRRLAPPGAPVPAPLRFADVVRRRAPEDYLTARLPGYGELRMLERATPEGARVYSEVALPQVYAARSLDGSPALGALLAAAFDPAVQPSRLQTLRLPDEPRRSFRLARNGRAAEVRFFLQGRELSRTPAWRVRAVAGQGEAAGAFDNRDVTGCDCALEIDFQSPLRFDEVRIYGNRGVVVPLPRGLRRQAVVELRRRGFTHILASESGGLGGELDRNRAWWGVTEVGSGHGAHVYQLD